MYAHNAQTSDNILEMVQDRDVVSLYFSMCIVVYK